MFFYEFFKNGFLQYPRWLLLNGSKNYSSTSFQYLKQHVWLFNKNNSTIKNLTLDDILSGQTNSCIILLSSIVYHLFDSQRKSCYILQEKTYDYDYYIYIFSASPLSRESHICTIDFKVLLILGKYCSCLTLFKSFLNLEQLQQDFKHSKKYNH